MSTLDERSLGVARLYAKAILAVAQEQGAAESLGEELAGVLEQAERDEEFALFLSSPIVEREQRSASIEKALRGRASDLLVDSLQIINRKDRLGILSQILVAYREQRRELLNQVEIRVTTAVPLNDEYRDALRRRTSETTGKEAFLTESVDPDLLGGVVYQVGDRKVDMSVRRDLELISSRLAERLSEELLSGSEFATGSDTAEAGSHDGKDEEE